MDLIQENGQPRYGRFKEIPKVLITIRTSTKIPMVMYSRDGVSN